MDPDDMRRIRLAPAPAAGLSLITETPGAVYRANLDARRTVTFVSRHIEVLTGRPADAFNTRRVGLLDIVHPDDRAAVREVLGTAPPHMELEYRVVHGDGFRWVLDRASAPAVGQPCMDGTLLEITNRRADAGAALHDPLTGLASLRALEDRIGVEAAPVSLVLLDVDGLARINNTHGHETGDRVLVEVARGLRGGIRPIDLAVRMAGGEFAVLLAATRLSDAVAVTERIRARIERIVHHGLPAVTVSAGVAQVHGGAPLAAARAALARAKASGRNRVVAAPPSGDRPPPVAA